MNRKDTIPELTKYVNLLYKATFFNYDFMKKQAINQINLSFPDIAEEVRDEWCRQYPHGGLTYHQSVFQLTPMGASANVDLYLHVINRHINQYYHWFASSTAILKLFFQPQPLSCNDVLYTEDGKHLTVSDFLSVLSYGKRFAEEFFGMDSTKVGEYVHAIQTVCLAIDHKEVDKPINETLHVINAVLMECIRDFQRTKGEKRLEADVWLLLDLTIDFLVKG